MAENNTIHKIRFTPRVYPEPVIIAFLATEDLDFLITEEDEDLIA